MFVRDLKNLSPQDRSEANQAIHTFQSAPNLTPSTREQFIKKEREKWKLKDALQKQKDFEVILNSVRATISTLPSPAAGATPATPTPAPTQRLATPTLTQQPTTPSTPLSAQPPHLSAQALHAALAATRQETQARQIDSLLREQQTLRRLLAERDRRDRSRSRERKTRDRNYRDDRRCGF